MLDLLAAKPKFTLPPSRAAAATIDRYLLRARVPLQQQTRRPPLLLSIDGTDGQTLDHFITLTAYYADRVIVGDKTLLISLHHVGPKTFYS